MNCQKDSNGKQNHSQVPAVFVASASAKERKAQEPIGKQCNHSYQNHNQSHKSDVVVADMGEFVCSYTFQLGFIKLFQTPAGVANYGVLGVAAGGKCVWGAVIYN